MFTDESDWRQPNSWQRAFWGDLVGDPQFRLKTRLATLERAAAPAE